MQVKAQKVYFRCDFTCIWAALSECSFEEGPACGRCHRRYDNSLMRGLSPHMGCIEREGVRRNALRVLRPKSLHSEKQAQYIEWRDPTGPRQTS